MQSPRKPFLRALRALCITMCLMLLALTVAVTISKGFLAAADKVLAASQPTPASTTYPFVVITSPVSGEVTDSGLTWTVTVAAIDPRSAITKVALYDETKLVGTTTVAPYTFGYTVTAGPHTLTAVATDATGAAGTSLPVVISGDIPASPTSPPTAAGVVWTSPANSATFIAPATIVMSVKLSISSPYSGGIDVVDYYSGTTLVGSSGVGASFTWTNVPAGTYVLVAVARNNTLGGGVTTTPITVTVTGTAQSCAVKYVVVSEWHGSFTAEIFITNTSSTPINGWKLQFAFSDGQKITQLWSGHFTQAGSQVTVTNASYNGQIPPGAQVNPYPGFIATWGSKNTHPTSFTLNGQDCSLSA